MPRSYKLLMVLSVILMCTRFANADETLSKSSQTFSLDVIREKRINFEGIEIRTDCANVNDDRRGSLGIFNKQAYYYAIDANRAMAVFVADSSSSTEAHLLIYRVNEPDSFRWFDRKPEI